jgi:hypothetical protein
MRSTFINIVLMLVLGITILPIAQVGSLLYNNQLTEEKSNAEDGGFGSSGKKADFTEPAVLGTGWHVAGLSSFFEASSYIHFAETLPPSHRGDIHSPPPNA